MNAICKKEETIDCAIRKYHSLKEFYSREELQDVLNEILNFVAIEAKYCREHLGFEISEALAQKKLQEEGCRRLSEIYERTVTVLNENPSAFFCRKHGSFPINLRSSEELRCEVGQKYAFGCQRLVEYLERGEKDEL